MKSERASGDAAKVKRYKDDRAAFEEDNVLPKAIDRAEYNRSLAQAQQALRKVFTKVQAYYLREKQDAEAEELEEEFTALVNAAADIRQPIGTPRFETGRWHNETYDTTLSHIKGKEWTEVHNKTSKTHMEYTEKSRTKEYLELYCKARDHHIRFYDKRAELLKNGKWEWVATGQWSPPLKLK